LGKNQYTFNVESGFLKTEIKHWVELFFGVKVVAMNIHRLPGKGKRRGPILEQLYIEVNARQVFGSIMT
jgi:ribosomal protein L23